MAVPFTGGCACGAIQYECTAAPRRALNCHCRDCQRMSGSAAASLLSVAAPTVRFTHGHPKYFRLEAESGHAKHYGFCPACGSPVCCQIDELPDLVFLTAGSLDDPSWYQPQMDVFTSSAQPWAMMNPELPKFEKRPTK